MKDRNDISIRERHRVLAVKYGKAPVCIWDSTHTQGGHGFEWANVTGVYTCELEDYLPMCIPCHRRFDTTEYMREQASLRSKGRIPVNRVVIEQYTPEGLFVASYLSMTQAAQQAGVCVSSIAQNLANKSKLSAGYKWRYA